MKNGVKAWVALAAIAALAAVFLLLSPREESYAHKYAGADFSKDVVGIARENTYASYLMKYADAPSPSEDVSVDLLAYSAVGDVKTEGDTVFAGENSSITWRVNVPEAGFYRLSVEYLTVESRGISVERKLSINGEIPFSGAETLLLRRLWTDEGEVRKDNQGNEIRPAQAEVYAWQRAYFKDSLGYETAPFRFYFHEGVNTITLEAVNEPVVMRALCLCACESTPTYAEYRAACPTEGGSAARGYLTIVQGEAASLRSSPSLYAKYDRSSPATVPASVTNTVLNYIGGTAWNTPGDWIEFEIEVPEDGLYRISIKGRQNYLRGGLSGRAMYLDGEAPFREIENITFAYQNAWNTLTPADENGEAYQFYLTKGKHTVRLEATLGDMGPILSALEDSIYRLNQIYRRILVLTGANPDRFRDYNIADLYPEVIEAMNLESKRLYALVDRTVAVTGQKNDRIAVAQVLASQLEKFVENNDRITRSFANFKDNITSLGAAMQNMSETGLDIDYIVVSGTDAEIPAENEGFIRRVLHEIESCIASYTVRYDMIGDVYDESDEEVLEAWIMTGRDQSTILKTMIDDTFTPETGIKVSLKLVDPGALLGAVVAGNGPDIVLSTDSWNPVQYALRGAAEDLTQFPDAQNVLAQFAESAYSALSLDGGVYALPETQTFNVLFYRSDVLEELGLEVPNTWDDLVFMLSDIQGSNLSVGIPFPVISSPNLSVFYSMVYQNGGSIYNDNATRTLLDGEEGVKAFKRYTSLYTQYGLVKEFDFLSRFRSGEMPIGIADFTLYNTLTVSAPEIRGLWDFTLIPGTERATGEGTIIDRSDHCGGASCMMIAAESDQIKQDGWEFLKWWISAETQTRFGRELESVLGESARYATANIEAFANLPWSVRQLDVLTRQRAETVGFREIAGGYYTQWHMTNALRKVAFQWTDPRETLMDYARIINAEITKKRGEFGLVTE